MNYIESLEQQNDELTTKLANLEKYNCALVASKEDLECRLQIALHQLGLLQELNYKKKENPRRISNAPTPYRDDGLNEYFEKLPL